MTTETKSSPATGDPLSPAPSAPLKRKPRFALFIATACGLGYIPIAPGTWGSLCGIVPTALPWWTFFGAAAVSGFIIGVGPIQFPFTSRTMDPFLFCNLVLLLLIGSTGVWSARQAANYWQRKDPQKVVIDEVSGQHLTFLLGCALPTVHGSLSPTWSGTPIALIAWDSPVYWKYLLLGFILFRVFDIWKPFPARQAESLPGGWGIMADDWVAGIYAGIGLWIARLLGL
jgi:phosphatidylglycerophosphatase A